MDDIPTHDKYTCVSLEYNDRFILYVMYIIYCSMGITHAFILEIPTGYILKDSEIEENSLCK